MRVRARAVAASAALAVAATGASCGSGPGAGSRLTLSGQGSSFVSNFLEQCKADVKNTFDIDVSYQPTGSGAGRIGFISGTVDFAASDVPFSASELGQLDDDQGFVYLPVTAGAIAIVFRLPGVRELRLSGPTIAKIFSGAIVEWDDPEIVRENPATTMPDEFIRVVVRSDSSGTSTVFTDYLTRAGGGAWTKGVTKTFPVPRGNGIAQRGTDGATNFLDGPQGKYGITYAEVSFAKQRGLDMAKVINAAGQAVPPDASNVTAAIGAAMLRADGTVQVDYLVGDADAYPISAVSYVIAPTTLSRAKGEILRDFLSYTVGPCQQQGERLGYAPLPRNLADRAAEAIARINAGSATARTTSG